MQKMYTGMKPYFRNVSMGLQMHRKDEKDIETNMHESQKYLKYFYMQERVIEKIGRIKHVR